MRDYWVGLSVAALSLCEAMAASPQGADDGVSQGYALPIGLGVLLLAATMLRRRRGRS